MAKLFELILCDMDGVIANFHLEAVRAHLLAGRRLPQIGTLDRLSATNLFKHWPRGLSLSTYLCPDVTDPDDHCSKEMEAFWEPIDRDPLFWQKILPFDHTTELLKLLHSYAKTVAICTTPHTHSFSYAGKRAWLYRYNLQDYELIYCKHKWRLADRYGLLLDDHEPHINSWRTECHRRYAVTGKAILFPAVWNENHSYAHDPLHYVKEQLEALKG